MRRNFVLTVLLALIAAGVYAAEKPVVERSDLKGSNIMIVKPASWNGKLLIVAHGYRPEGTPLACTIPYKNNELYRQLLKEGWMLAASSYRMNGWAVKVGIKDIASLYDYIVRKYGKPDKTYLRGSSMGGLMAVLIAEQPRSRYDGILAVCPVIGKNRGLSFNPKVPILFLCNSNEAGSEKKYLDNLVKGSVKPAAWTVTRKGHCNTNGKEELSAFRALVDYSEGKPIKMANDCTVEKKPASRAVFKDGGAYAKVTKVSNVYGNFDTEFTKADLKKAGIEKGKKFVVKFGKKRYDVYYGDTYFNVPRGEWIAFVTADGYLKIARNFADAIKLLGCKEGDTIFIGKKYSD